MTKKYQVFVSSTYLDLVDERNTVINTLMKIDCIPAGMELFPAADEEQLEFIKKIIDESDYYLRIIGGRYGSITSDGVSFTEKEYDYAMEKGLNVIALIHSDPDILPACKTETSQKALKKLALFRKKVSSGRIVKYWANSYELSNNVAVSLINSIKRYPATGWVKGDQILPAYNMALKLSNEGEKRSKLPKLLIKHNRVLWVDDYPQANKGIIDLFVFKGLKFDTATNTNKGIELLSDNDYDLIITDIGRENDDIAGLDFIRLVKNMDKKKDIPIIVFTGRSVVEVYRPVALRLGALSVSSGISEAVNTISQLFGIN